LESACLLPRHTQVLDFIGWINPVCREMFGIIDRFADTYSNGEQHCRKRLDNLFGAP
jgi:hypothetical protein